MVKSKKHRKKVILITIICILTVIASGIIGGKLYINHLLNQVKRTKLPASDKALGINDDLAKEYKQYEASIVNIAFFGVDRRNPDNNGSSDSLIIITIDTIHNKLKMTSVMRDTYVNVEGHDKDKITYAYAYGGAKLAVKTLNQNFNLNIKDYVTVDFFDLAKLIDKLGGVQINVQPDEIPMINDGMIETSQIDKISYTPVTKSGLQTLNGMQAVAYSRIRHLSGGDFVRTERQRTVLTVLFNKIKNQSTFELAQTINSLLPYVETSLTNDELISIGSNALKIGIDNLQQERFPLDGYCTGLFKDNIWYLNTDLTVTSKQLDDYIFNDVAPVPGKPTF